MSAVRKTANSNCLYRSYILKGIFSISERCTTLQLHVIAREGSEEGRHEPLT